MSRILQKKYFVYCANFVIVFFKEDFLERVDTVVVPCPAIDDNRRSFPEIVDGIYLGGEARLEGLMRWYNRYPRAVYVLVGAKKRPGQRLAEAELAREVFCRRHRRAQIVVVHTHPCTLHNWLGIFAQQPQLVRGKHVALSTNLYHGPRALALWENALSMWQIVVGKLPGVFTPSAFLPSEEMLPGYPQPARRPYLRRRRLERQGLEALHAGKYYDGCTGRNVVSVGRGLAV